jgi:hypothetical protein
MSDQVIGYRPRPLRYLRRWEHQDWRLKVYGISAWGDRPPDDLIAAGEQLAIATLPTPALADGRHGVGLLGVHDGKGACFVFVSWWAKTYELNHCLFRAPRGKYSELARVEPTLFGCTWDLHILAFERDAWVSSMLGTADGAPDLDVYLSARLDSNA